MEKNIKSVPAHNIHQSSILPPRQHNEELTKSVKQLGIQQPIIVRPIAGKNDEYEIVDGQGRMEAVGNDEQVLIDVRHDLKDSEVFRISESTFQRKERTAYETARFYAAWLKTLEKQEGVVEGLQQKLADQANLSESSLSQYVAIARLFEKLQELAPKETFSRLKALSINKVYKLSMLSDNPHLVDVATLFESKSETSIEEVENTVSSLIDDARTEELLGDENQTPDNSQPNSIALQQPNKADGKSKKNCLSRAKKVESLATETHKILDTTIQGLVNNIDKCSSEEVLQLLNDLLRILRKLRSHSSVLQQKMNWTQGGSG